jgi:unsaturated chondroitin disaccharide hydrolase
MSKARINAAITTALARMRVRLPRFSDRFPAPASMDGVYPAIENVEWTNGFWTGMLVTTATFH